MTDQDCYGHFLPDHKSCGICPRVAECQVATQQKTQTPQQQIPQQQQPPPPPQGVTPGDQGTPVHQVAQEAMEGVPKPPPEMKNQPQLDQPMPEPPLQIGSETQPQVVHQQPQEVAKTPQPEETPEKEIVSLLKGIAVSIQTVGNIQDQLIEKFFKKYVKLKEIHSSEVADKTIEVRERVTDAQQSYKDIVTSTVTKVEDFLTALTHFEKEVKNIQVAILELQDVCNKYDAEQTPEVPQEKETKPVEPIPHEVPEATQQMDSLADTKATVDGLPATWGEMLAYLKHIFDNGFQEGDVEHLGKHAIRAYGRIAGLKNNNCLFLIHSMAMQWYGIQGVRKKITSEYLGAYGINMYP